MSDDQRAVRTAYTLLSALRGDRKPLPAFEVEVLFTDEEAAQIAEAARRAGMTPGGVHLHGRAGTGCGP